ncbi:HYR domain-containing protein [Archangium minus]|uniref:HYR domain-containing protein n=1 Tax=Archangium minus TaxID=83450 RepID=A0ABY9X360_9BACT|nr:HYR domain-containing protein [Archangium minus]
MRRYSTGVSSLLSVCALAGVCASTRADALETCQPITLVKNIAPGPASSIPDLYVQTPAVRGKTVFFTAKDGTTGLELWRSRGKEGDTALVKDIFPGSKDSEPRFLTVVGDTLFFIADDGAHGAELWKSDGTADGTVLVRDIRPGTEGSEATALTALGNTLFFIANNGVNGLELWKSDGTEAGTELVADLVPGSLGSGLSSLTVMRNTLFFAADGGPQETELWRSDGTKDGTERVAVVRVIESDPGEELIQGLTAVDDRLYFFAGSAYKKRWDLWKSDGTGPGTVRVTPLALSAADYAMGPDSMTPVGELIYFRAGADGSLWRSDGTDKGTSLIKPSADARFLTNLNGTLVFTAWDEASGFELWRSDGTVAGTVLVEDIRPGSDSSAPSWLTVVDGKVLFSAETTESGRELWSSDGTLERTEMLQDAVPGPGSLSPSLLTPVGPRVFFLAGDNTSAGASDIGAEPWVLNDCTPPTISCPSEMTAEAWDSSGAPVKFPAATGHDNKPEPPVFSYSHATGETFPLGPTQVTATATDESGNSAQCSFTVKVRDTQPPTIICPQDHEVWRTTRYGATVDYPKASASDSVSSPALTYNPPPGSDFIVGITPVVVTATDAAGNTSRCTFQVGVSRQYARGSCGCGASSTSEFAGGLLLSTLALLAGRRRKSGTPRNG